MLSLALKHKYASMRIR